MKKIIYTLLFSAITVVALGQDCNVNEAIKNFTAAQEAGEEESAELFEKAAQEFKCSKQYENYLISAYQAGVAYFNIDNFSKAKFILEQSISDTYGITDSTSEVYMLIYHALGEAYYTIGEPGNAVNYYKKAINILGNDDSEELAVCLFNIGNSYEMLALHNEAVASHRKSIEMKERLEIADSSDYYQAYSALGDIYQTIGRQDSSDYYFQAAGKFLDISNSESLAYIKFKEAQKYYDEKDTKAAESLFEEVKNICEVSSLKKEIYTSSCLYLALINEADENTKKAETLLVKALENQTEKNDLYYNILLAYGRIEKADNQQKAFKKLDEVVRESKNTELENLARIEIGKMYEQIDVPQAKIYYSHILSTADSVKQAIIYAQAVCGMAAISSTEGNGEKAVKELLRAQRILNGQDKEFEANIYEQIGNEYFKLGNNDKAIINYRQAFSILSKQFGNESLKALSAEENLANVYMSAEQFDKASEIYQHSLTEKAKAKGENNPQLIDLYSNYANALYNQNKYDEAGKIYDRCLQIIEKERIKDTELDVFYNNYGLFCKASGDYKVALKSTEYSLNAKRQKYGEQNIKYANTLNNLGTIYDRLGNFSKSAECYEKAEQIVRAVESETSAAMSDVYINKGNLYNRLGQNELALTYYNKALEIKEKHNPADKKLASIYNNVGTVYQNVEDYRLAQYFFKKSLDLTKKYLGENSQEVAESYNNLGNVMLKTGKKREAISNYLKASGIYKSIPGINQVLIGNTNNNIATVYQQENQLDSALIYYQQSADLYQKVFGGKHPYLALIYNNIGNIEVKLENFEDAMRHFNLAIESNHDSFNSKTDSLPNKSGYYDQNIFVNSILSRAAALAGMYNKSQNFNDLEFAFKHYIYCDGIIADMRRSALTKTDKLELGKIASKCYEGALELCTQILAFDLKEKQRQYYEEQAFAFVEKGKSNSLLESMAGQDAMELANIPEELKQKENQLSADVLYYEKMLAEKPKNATQVRDSLLAANKKHSAFIKKLETEFPEYHQLKYADNTVGLRELQQKLAAGTQLRLYVLGDDAVFTICVTDNKFGVSVKKVSKNLADSVKMYRNSMINTSQNAVVEFGKLSRRLFNILFSDAIPDDVKRLVIVPDGALNQIPYESLLTDEIKGSIYNYTDYAFLIKKYPVSYAYSATLYYRDITRNRENGTDGWFGLAPIFTQGKFPGVELDTRLKKQERPISNLNVVINTKLEPLASSEAEVRNIFGMFAKAGQPAKACMWGAANRQNFSSDSIAKYRYIHLATHGFVNSEKPELSGVQLSHLQGDSQEGVLYSNDVYGLKLNCDLLVLSACETGLGKIMKGEGIVGLSRAFIYAGSKNLLVSLWKVSDNSTSQMMVEFYKQLLSKEKTELNYAEILQKAKLMLILGKDYSRPYYWAPFILIGD